MSKFKIGDRVITTEKFETHTKAGLVGTLVAFEKTCWGDVVVEFDNKVEYGHSADGKAKYGHGRYGNSRGLKPVENRKIVITSNGAETLARLYEGNKVIKTATAKCSPDDTYNFDEGARIAFHRLIGDYAEVKKKKPRVYKAGDKVKVIANTCVHSIKIGEVVTLTKIYREYADGNNCWDTKEHGECYIRECDFEPYVEPKKPKYYNGKVVCVSETTDMTIGKIYEIKNGKLVDDVGDQRPHFKGERSYILSLDEGWARGKLIPLVE